MWVLAVLGFVSAVCVAGWWFVLALAGRSGHPARERVPVHRWTCADLAANGLRGSDAVASLHRAARGGR